MSIFKPDSYYVSIFDINYNKLKKQGIFNIFMDLDNTISKVDKNIPNNKVIKLFEKLKKDGFNVIIFSNSFNNRVMKYADILDVDYIANGFKPFLFKYKKVCFEKKIKKNEVCMIGDQFLTDIYGGNRFGIKTILVDPVSTKDFVFTTFNRKLEKIIEKKLANKNLFVRGEYYD